MGAQKKFGENAKNKPESLKACYHKTLDKTKYMEKHENHKYLCFLLFTIAHRKLTWARRLVQIQSCPEYSHILSRNQSRCKGNYSEVHKVGRKEKDVNKSNFYILIILFIIYYNSCIRIIILHYILCELWFSRMHCFRNSKISDHWNISNPNERHWFWRKNTVAVLGCCFCSFRALQTYGQNVLERFTYVNDILKLKIK